MCWNSLLPLNLPLFVLHFFFSWKLRCSEISDWSTALAIMLPNAASLSGRQRLPSKWSEREQLPGLMGHENHLPLNRRRSWHLSRELQSTSMQIAPSICCSNYDSSHVTTKTQGGQSLAFQRCYIYSCISSFSVAARPALWGCTRCRSQSQPGWAVTALHTPRWSVLFVCQVIFLTVKLRHRLGSR